MPVEKSVESLPAHHAFSCQVHTGKDAAAQNEPNAEVTDLDADGEEDPFDHPSSHKMRLTRLWNGSADWRLIKVCNIGPTQTQSPEDSHRELFVLSRKFMDDSKLNKLLMHSVNATAIFICGNSNSSMDLPRKATKSEFSVPDVNCETSVKIIRGIREMKCESL
jgi:hypothetical protein